jgi:hypothetical protein
MGPDIGPIMENQIKKACCSQKVYRLREYRGRAKKKNNSIDVLIYIY